MNNKKIARIYAQALFKLGIEQNINIVGEMILLNELIRECNDLENLIFLEVFSLEEKHQVLSAVFNGEKSFSTLFTNFIFFLLQERRLGLLLTIYQELVILDDHQKGFISGVIEGRDEGISPTLENKILAHLQEKLQLTPKLQYRQNSEITAGYKITAGNYQIDSRLDRQLSQMQEQILNDYQEKL